MRRLTCVYVRIMAFFVIGFFFTFATSFLQQNGAFGDEPCPSTLLYGCTDNYVWGVRHYWYVAAQWASAILYSINLGLFINKHWDEL